MGEFELPSTWLLYGGLLIVLLVAVLLFFRWSQSNIRANTQRIKQQLADEAASPPVIDMPAGTPRGDGEAIEMAREWIAPIEEKLDALGQRLRAVEDRLARLEQGASRAHPLDVPGAAPRSGGPAG